jgi:hypothetical protein
VDVLNEDDGNETQVDTSCDKIDIPETSDSEMMEENEAFVFEGRNR